MKILITEAEPDDLAYFPLALAGHEVRCVEEPIDRVPVEDLADVEALSVFLGAPVGRNVMDATPRLRIVATRSTGYDHIDRAAATERGVVVCNVPEYGSATVAEFTFALILALTRKVHRAYLHGLEGVFSVEGLIGVDLAGKTLGVVGLGRIGERVTRMGLGFGMRVVAFDPYAGCPADVEAATLETLLAESDVIALCCPLTKSTFHLIDGPAFDRMRSGAFLVNTARGGVIDTAALLRALESGRLAGVALDVLEGEELMRPEGVLARAANAEPEDALRMARNFALMRHPKAIVTPHLAFASAEAVGRIRATTVDNLLAFAQGEPRNAI